MDYTKDQLKNFYDEIGFENGWDFSRLRCVVEGKEWNFYDEVKKKGGERLRLLDIGTGGGEKVLQIANYFQDITGIDVSEGMISTARKNLAISGFHNVEFVVMDAGHLQFPDQTFDVVSCRHSDFNPSEVYRILKKDGVFLTQQVSETDKFNIKQIFGRGQAFGLADGAAQDAYVLALKNAGFLKVGSLENNATEYYERLEDLIFLLKHTPIIPGFGKEIFDFEKLDQFIKENVSVKGIKTNSKRYMLVAKK